MHKFLLKTVLVFLPALLFVQQQGYAQCTLPAPSSVSVSADGGKCGAVVTYNPPAVPAACSSPQKVDATFAFTGDVQTFVVPDGVTSVTIQTWGAQGGGGDDTNEGGLGGYTAGTRAVQPGDILYVYVGSQPEISLTDTFHSGGYNGGGNSWGLGGGGGGASDVRTGGISFSNRIIVAGGGGGLYAGHGGAGGGLAGTNGEISSGNPDGVGGGGTQTYGGAGTGGTSGSFGQGGSGEYNQRAGGGGGYYGGGAGYYASGGGGSGYVGGVTDTSMQTGVNSGHGKVVISYNKPVTLSTNIFTFTGDVQTFVVPSGVTSVTIKTWGAQGGGSDYSNNGGLGGYAAGTLAVQPGDVLNMYVGSKPAGANTDGIPNPGGYNGGGNGWGFGGGGGGASDVRMGGTGFSNRLIVAGGGGGEWFNGGAGGGLAGTSGESSSSTPGGGGGGGTQTEGGAKGINGGSAGSFGQGGGANENAHQTGGGGGYYGGGSSSGFGGAGGGSGYVGGVTAGSMQTGVNSGHGKVEISYSLPVALSLVQTDGLSSGAFFPVGITTNSFALVSSNGDTLSKASSTVTVTDTEKPIITCPAAQKFCYNSTGSYSIPAVGASDNCGVQTTSYSITGATTRSGTGNNATGSFNAGISTITWTVTDVHGNQASCQTIVTVNPQILVSIPDVKVLSKGVDANTVYAGYAPASTITLTAQASGGSGTLRYKWSNGATTASIKVSPAANTTYTVTITDASNCTATATKVVKVVNVSCSGAKVSVCHSGGTLCVDKSSVPVHLGHGDKLGKCGTTTATSMSQIALNDVLERSLAAGVYPNPTRGAFTLQLNNGKAGSAQLLIRDYKGAVIQHKTIAVVQGTQTLQMSLQGKAAGLYLLQVRGETSVQTFKVYLQQ